MGIVYRFRRLKRLPSPWAKHANRSHRWPQLAAIVGAAMLGGLVVHFSTGGTIPSFLRNSSIGAVASSFGGRFGICRLTIAKDCVIDGDTIQVGGQRIRMVDYDTPEISEPHCASEYAAGQRAKFRLLELLNSGEVEVRPWGARDEDKYGRKLRLVLVDGRSVGDTLIAEGLAWPWEGHRHAWC